MRRTIKWMVLVLLMAMFLPGTAWTEESPIDIKIFIPSNGEHSLIAGKIPRIEWKIATENLDDSMVYYGIITTAYNKEMKPIGKIKFKKKSDSVEGNLSNSGKGSQLIVYIHIDDSAKELYISDKAPDLYMKVEKTNHADYKVLESDNFYFGSDLDQPDWTPDRCESFESGGRYGVRLYFSSTGKTHSTIPIKYPQGKENNLNQKAASEAGNVPVDDLAVISKSGEINEDDYLVSFLDEHGIIVGQLSHNFNANKKINIHSIGLPKNLNLTEARISMSDGEAIIPIKGKSQINWDDCWTRKELVCSNLTEHKIVIIKDETGKRVIKINDCKDGSDHVFVPNLGVKSKILKNDIVDAKTGSYGLTSNTLPKILKVKTDPGAYVVAQAQGLLARMQADSRSGNAEFSFKTDASLVELYIYKEGFYLGHSSRIRLDTSEAVTKNLPLKKFIPDRKLPEVYRLFGPNDCRGAELTIVAKNRSGQILLKAPFKWLRKLPDETAEYTFDDYKDYRFKTEKWEPGKTDLYANPEMITKTYRFDISPPTPSITVYVKNSQPGEWSNARKIKVKTEKLTVLQRADQAESYLYICAENFEPKTVTITSATPDVIKLDLVQAKPSNFVFIPVRNDELKNVLFDTINSSRSLLKGNDKNKLFLIKQDSLTEVKNVMEIGNSAQRAEIGDFEKILSANKNTLNFVPAFTACGTGSTRVVYINKSIDPEEIKRAAGSFRNYKFVVINISYEKLPPDNFDEFQNIRWLNIDQEQLTGAFLDQQLGE